MQLNERELALVEDLRPRVKFPGLEALRVFRLTGFEDMLIVYRPLAEGVEILRVVPTARGIFERSCAAKGSSEWS